MIPVELSIIIVSRDTRGLTLDRLHLLYAQTRDLSFEVSVIDSASADGSVAAIAAEVPQVHLIANVENRGFASANNQALRPACGEYVLLLNSDTTVLDGAIDKLVAFANSKPQAGYKPQRIDWESFNRSRPPGAEE